MTEHRYDRVWVTDDQGGRYERPWWADAEWEDDPGDPAEVDQ